MHFYFVYPGSGLPPAFSAAVRQLLLGATEQQQAGRGQASENMQEVTEQQCLLHLLPPEIIELIISKAALPTWESGPCIPSPPPVYMKRECVCGGVGVGVGVWV